VEHGALICRQGRTHGAPGAREVLHPALHDVGSIIWLDGAGSLTIAALEWLNREGASVLMLNASGEPLAASIPDSKPQAALRRAQYMAASTGRDVTLARAIVTRKLAGQQDTLRRHAAILTHAGADGLERAYAAFDMAFSWLNLPASTPFLDTLDGLRQFEGRCARAYFAALELFPLRWLAGDVKAGRVPDFWRTLGQRGSPLSAVGNGRNAVRPGQAVLNLCYGALAGDVRTALLAAGLDPACGFLHADSDRRDSLVWDMVELQRGAVEAKALTFLAATTLRAGAFARADNGGVRLHPDLARLTLATCRASRTELAADAKWLTRELLVERTPASV
ncbi:MAG: CRISPR-associated endonuclease Cas1, partial [Ktedonobacterales bacterium]